MELHFIILIILWKITFAFFCWYVAKEKNRSQVSWFVLGLLFSIIAMLALIAIPVKVKEEKRAGTIFG